jgi:hypothetical protein
VGLEERSPSAEIGPGSTAVLTSCMKGERSDNLGPAHSQLNPPRMDVPHTECWSAVIELLIPGPITASKANPDLV